MTTQYIRGKEIAEKYAPGKDLIVCIGGDGTFNEVVAALIENKMNIPLGYIPAGSTNDFAASLGLSTNPIKAAQDIIDGEKVTVDAGVFGGRIFTYVASFGVFTKSSYATSRDLKNSLGHFAYIIESMKEITDIKPLHLRITTEEKTVEGKYLFGAICNTTRIGGGAIKLPKDSVDLSDGLFEIVLIKNPTNPAETVELLTDFQSFNTKSKMIEFFSASKCEIETEDNIDWTIDGEFQKGRHKIIVKNIKNAITLVVNKGNGQLKLT
jgi:YegS/Rv2252/BmrU family lipid kinase